MLTVEVFAGRVPFSDVGKIRAALQIVRGERPGKPQAAEQLGLTMEMWKLIERCWDADPNKRPTIDEVVRTWEGFANGYVVSSFGWSASQHITTRGNSRASVSKTSGHHSRSTGSSTNHTENTSKPYWLQNPHDVLNHCKQGDQCAGSGFVGYSNFLMHSAGPRSCAFRVFSTFTSGVGFCLLFRFLLLLSVSNHQVDTSRKIMGLLCPAPRSPKTWEERTTTMCATVLILASITLMYLRSNCFHLSSIYLVV